jgi:DNA-directed RNA polymerase subunit M/transcription elongation factor TFIIS
MERKMRKVKCPNCGYEYQENVEKIYEDGETTVVKGREKSTLVFSKRKKCVDLVCPNCKKEFEFCWDK